MTTYNVKIRISDPKKSNNKRKVKDDIEDDHISKKIFVALVTGIESLMQAKAV